MWPSPTALPHTALLPRRNSQQLPASSSTAYESSHRISLSGSSMGSDKGSGNGFGLWQCPHPSDVTMVPKIAELWPRRASEASSSSFWLDDYWNAAVADCDDPDEDDDFTFFPRQTDDQPCHKQNNFVLPPMWLPGVLDDDAQQKAAQVVQCDERLHWPEAFPAEPQVMCQYQRQYQLHLHLHHHQQQQQQQRQQRQQPQLNPPVVAPPTTTAPAVTKTFKPMQMVFREHRRTSASSTGMSNSGGTGTGTATTAMTAATTDTAFRDAMMHQQAPAATIVATARRGSSSSTSQYPQRRPPLSSSPSSPSAASMAALYGSAPVLPLEEQVFRRQQGISLNYRGDIRNPHNRGDHVPAHLNTSLFLMGLPPQATVGDLLRAVAALGPTGRIYAASVNPPDPARRLPLAAAKISFFSRQQAERLKALIDAQQLVLLDSRTAGAAHPGAVGGGGRPFPIRCAWNRDKKPPRQCVQANECRVLRIRGPADVVNFEALAAYFDEKFRYELQDVRVVPSPTANGDSSSSSSSGGSRSNRPSSGGALGDEQTMEWRFASFQSQAIAAKMALNQERKMVRVEYGRDPCEWGECS
ncbi:hypothetical protein HMPREF1624_05862 [Sporothrix schenckii ATCC 58251]|uniref:RRM domain-containing protein n=1 Tax=Sporothrix schenckii (strain ATCC 58251 / de Perez 2211183) TaxID=1391915 RepID=U7PRW6_SPOS1|nr:hypothetical protein HMPREF1624_05862 [Sporothrix schenckii ATCC 58251]